MKVGLLLIASIFVLALHGSLPYVGLPTLGQAVALMGFSQSFSEAGLLTLHSSHFGWPSRAALAMGMPVALPSGVLISIGMHAADAYSVVVACWMLIALLGAYAFGRTLRVSHPNAVLGAVVWLAMPMTWAHADYSSLAIGISLLPTYMFVAMRVYAVRAGDACVAVAQFKSIPLYAATCVIALFMDGYSFMMFAVGSSVVAAGGVILNEGSRLARVGLFSLIQAGSFGLAYVLYTSYTGVAEFEPAALDFFRGWGLDLTFLVRPSLGVYWLWDLLGVSVSRSREQYFGDASVWNTTFALPLMIAAFGALLVIRRSGRLALLLIVLSGFAFYMALGPSLKVGATKPQPMGDLMPAEFAGPPTGSALVSAHLPGFKNMRASYRWFGLAQFGLWAVVMLASADRSSVRAGLVSAVVLLTLLITQLPNMGVKWNNYASNRSSFLQIDRDLVAPLARDLRPGELVAFLPFRNDFLVNYLAPKAGVRTFNIGGDKQLGSARQYWPRTMRGFAFGRVDDDFVDRLILLLVRGEAGAVILPYVDLLWAAHQWPYPIDKDELNPVIDELSRVEIVQIQEHEHYAVVRLAEGLERLAGSAELEAKLAPDLCLPPECLRRAGFHSVFSHVGVVEDRRLRSTGKAGFLHFGPYVHMNNGRYRLVVSGSANTETTAWVDVVSAGATVRHIRLEVSDEQRVNGVLVEGEFVLHDSVDDLEIRINVGPDDVVEVYGYELSPAGGISRRERWDDGFAEFGV
jgi:hypothetical protein